MQFRQGLTIVSTSPGQLSALHENLQLVQKTVAPVAGQVKIRYSSPLHVSLNLKLF
jgi:hypothetical protein